MRSLLALVVLVAGCGPMVLTPVVIREPRPDQVPLTIGVHYPEELRAIRKIPLTFVREMRCGQGADFKVLLGDASVTLFNDALGLLFTRVVSVPAVASAGAAQNGILAVIEPRIVAAGLEFRLDGHGQLFSRATVTYELTLYSSEGDRLASWTVSGAGLASTTGALNDTQSWNVDQWSLELALRDAAWNFTSGFRAVPGVRRWLDERGVK